MFHPMQIDERRRSALLAPLLALLLCSPFVEPGSLITLASGETRLIEIEQQHEEPRP